MVRRRRSLLLCAVSMLCGVLRSTSPPLLTAPVRCLRPRLPNLPAQPACLQNGNRSFQARQYQAAAEAYSEALALAADDAGLNAVLLCNRAAALHASGRHLEAIADCCLAEQLDGRSTRALQRRAEAYLALELYAPAVADLQRLLELSAGGSAAGKDAAARLRTAQACQRAQGSGGPNHYLLLGVPPHASAADVKAAYK